MKQTARLALAALAALTSTSLTFAARPADARPPVPMTHPAPSQQLKWDSKKFMRVSELRPGMRGYALTVFKGTKISKFGIEILGVVSKFNEGKDYILFRALDGPPVTRALGIAHGMSGSPIYIDGRLVGAISMGIPGTQFAKDPIALATPIEDMFDAWSPDLPQKPGSLSASAPTGSGAGLAQTRNFQPIGVPLVVSGMGARGLARLQTDLAPFHFDVMAGGGMGTDTATNPLAQGASLLPGSAVGVSLVQGDIDLTATGTVTYRDGNRLLLFGHPLAGLGPIDAALTTAYVVDIFPSYQDSIKIGSPIKTVGRIFQDRPFSVGAVIGPQPEMIPMTVSVNDLSIRRHRNYAVRIINHPLLTGQFVTEVADAAIEQVHGQPGDSIATVSMDVNVEEIGHVRRTNTYFDALSIDQAAVADLDSLMRMLSANPFYPLAVRSVKMDVTIQNRHDTAEIDHLFIKQAKFAPGDTVQVGVVLKPYKRPLYTRMVSLKIPQNTADGTLALSVRGGASEGGMTSLLGGLIQIRSSEPTGQAANVAQLVKNFVDKPRNDALVARLLLPTSAITLKGEKLSGLPPTLASVLQSPRTTGLRTERDEVKVTDTVPYIVSGSQTLSITVRRKDLSESPRAASGSSASGASSGGSGSDASSSSSDSGSSDGSPNMSSGGDGSEDAQGLILFDSLLRSKPKPTPSDAPAAATAGPSSDPGEADKTSDTASGGASPSSGGDDSDDTAPAPAAPVKPIGRLPSVWRQGTMADFAAGTLKNAAVTSLGDVRLSPALQKVADTPENYVWSILPDGKGNVYLGTGDGGAIYKMDASGKATPFFQTKELEVTSLAMGSDGNLYAGTAPHGLVFRVGADGKGEKVFTAQEKYVTALTEIGQSQIAVGTGGGTGRVYLINEHAPAVVSGLLLLGGGSMKNSDVLSHNGLSISATLFTSPEAHILSLATDKDGVVYAGSSPDGIVYKITPDGKSRVFYDAPEPSISALATDSQGNVYVGTASTGTVYRVAPDGTAKRLLGRASPGILSLRTDADDAVYAVSGSTIYKINPDDTVQSFVAQADEQFLSLALDPATHAVYAGTGTVGSVYKIGTDAAGSALAGTFQSVVHDAGGRARWGTLAWTADAPAGTSVALQTRSGDVERPDDSWSPWSAPLTNAAGQTVSSPPARFFQYQAALTGTSTGTAPKLRDVTLYYLPRDRAPVVSITKPTGGDAVAKAALISWSGSDPDKDTLVYDVSYSADSGKTWTPIKKRAVPGGAKSKASHAASESQANLDKQADVPASVRAKIAAQVKDNAGEGGSDAPAPAGKGAQGLKETSFSWDTTEVADGTYQVRVTASDKPSNPDGALSTKATSQPFLVANTPPTLTVGLPATLAGTAVLHGTATAGPAFVKAVQAKVEGGDPVAASADDGLFDSTSEAWTLTLSGLSSGSHKVEVQALDRAGNTATQTVTVDVP